MFTFFFTYTSFLATIIILIHICLLKNVPNNVLILHLVTGHPSKSY